MIAYLKGKLIQKDPTHIIMEVGGIGYFVKISLNTYTHLKELEEALLYTYLQIQENAYNLYGFIEESEKKLFLDLISVSGVGPNTAIMILSSLGAFEIKRAIVAEDVKLIQGVKGIGTKTAQRVILELKDKLKKDNTIAEAHHAGGPNYRNMSIKNEALEALVVLGIAKNVAEKNIEIIFKERGNNITVEELIKYALKM